MAMCDTLGRIGKGRSFFAKNSDRSPNEPQILEYHPGKSDQSGMVQCTYISVPQAQRTHAVLLSRPEWMWGAEMGINEFGLCIGNEAVFTKGAYGQTGLTGMDMVRLALERCATAREALDMIINLLENWDQGGNCGYDHDFYYDNAFLIMDRTDLYVLETAGKQWVYKRYEAANISNRLSIGADGDGYSGGKPVDFRKKYTEPVYTTFSGSGRRKAQIQNCLPEVQSVLGCMTALRCHDRSVKNPFAGGSVSSACMHYGGLVGDHTTASMVVSLEAGRMVVWSTGTSVPCVSLFKPWLFGTEPVLPVIHPEEAEGKQYWMEAEKFRRNLLGRQLPEEFYRERDAVQNRWISRSEEIGTEEFAAFSRACMEEEREFYQRWAEQSLEAVPTAPGFLRRWAVKSDILFGEQK